MWKKETGLEWLSREEEELVVKVPTDTGKDICMPSATVDKCLNSEYTVEIAGWGASQSGQPAYPSPPCQIKLVLVLHRYKVHHR